MHYLQNYWGIKLKVAAVVVGKYIYKKVCDVFMLTDRQN